MPIHPSRGGFFLCQRTKADVRRVYFFEKKFVKIPSTPSTVSTVLILNILSILQGLYKFLQISTKLEFCRKFLQNAPFFYSCRAFFYSCRKSIIFIISVLADL